MKGVFTIIFSGGAVIEITDDTVDILLEFQEYRAKIARGDNVDSLVQGKKWIVDMAEVAAVLVKQT